MAWQGLWLREAEYQQKSNRKPGDYFKRKLVDLKGRGVETGNTGHE